MFNRISFNIKNIIKYNQDSWSTQNKNQYLNTDISYI